MSGNAPTACAALPTQQKDEGLPLVYWLEGASVRSFQQDAGDRHGSSWPLGRNAQPYGDAFSEVKMKLGADRR
ncbi:hypothetical protein ACIBK8_35100 [Streptomyces sp. NPDC050161]|uniref:hypothetical protein n=1 Tax=Streptomyces sp. NPDC050161 TaxID=3365604 RepID=UPI0037BD5AAB